MADRDEPGRIDFHWMRDQLFALFRDAFRGSPAAMELGLQPAVDVVQFNGQVEIRIDLAGLTQEDVKVEVFGGRIYVRAEWTEESTQRDLQREERERNRRTFERSFRIPEGLDAVTVRSRYEHGLLTIWIHREKA